MSCEDFYYDEFHDILGSVTEDEIVMANKIYELSEKLEKVLTEDDSDIPEFLQSEDIKELDACIEQTLTETVRKEFIAVNRLERLLSQNRSMECEPMQRGFMI
jgi:hypothetical protein